MHTESDSRVATVHSRTRLVQFFLINKAFIIVWVALSIAVAGIAMVSPLLPVFAEEMGASGVWLGLAFSGFAITQVPLMPVVGRLSDRFGKKFFLWLGLLIYAIAALGYFWSPTYRELVFFRMLSGFGAAMVIPIAFSYIGELAPEGHEGRYMSLFNIALIAGFGLGPVLGGVINDHLGMDATFASMGILSILGFIIILLFLPRRASSSVLASPLLAAGVKEPSSSFVFMLRDATIRGIVTFQLVYGLLFGTLFAFVGIWMTTVINTSVAQVGIVLSARFIVNGTLAYPFGWFADRLNRVILVSAGMVMVAIGTFSIPWFRSFAPLLGLFIVIGIFESMAITSVNAMTVEKGRSMGMGSVMGVINMAISLGLLIGSMVGGVIEDSMGIALVFRWAAGIGLVGVTIFDVFVLRNAQLSKKPKSSVMQH